MVDKRDIQQLNRLYLLIAQRLASQDLDFACQVTGASKKALARIAELSVTDIEEMNGELNFILFKPRLNEGGFLKLLDLPVGTRGSFMSSALIAKGEAHEAT